jgi:CubicO group peptidase (beta-lactamase class C family)
MRLHVLPPAILAVAALARPVGAQAAAPRADLVAIADRVFAPWNSTHTPGCAVGIAQGGRTLLTRGYGMADLAGARPITPETVLESGSVAKQFTATAVLLLAKDGALSLDDDARRYLPELPDYGRTITVRHLLTHTSGLREWSNLVQWQGWPRGTRAHTQDVVFDLITRQRALNYPVGDFYSYTNSGFLLLRTLVERVSGQPFAQFTAERIFRPLGMTKTLWRDDFTRVVPGHALAYRRAADGWHLDLPFDDIVAAGGLLTTVGDWLTWNEALTADRLGVSDSLVRRMRLTSGLEIRYALGLIVNEYRGLRELSHSGSTAGYSTFLARYPERDHLSIAVLCNAAGAPATAYTHALVDALVPGLPAPPRPDTVAVDLPSLLRWRGIYRDTRTNTTRQLDTLQGRLRVMTAGGGAGATVQALRDGTMLLGGAPARPETGPDGRVTAFLQPTGDGDSVRFVRVADTRWVPAAAELAALAGRYRNDEIGATYTVAVANGRLTVSPRPGAVDTLVPTYRDAFDMRGGSAWFTRDRRGRVTALHFGSARAWDFVSVRVP